MFILSTIYPFIGRHPAQTKSWWKNTVFPFNLPYASTGQSG